MRLRPPSILGIVLFEVFINYGVEIRGRGGLIVEPDTRPVKLPPKGKKFERLIGLRQFLALMRKFNATSSLF